MTVPVNASDPDASVEAPTELALTCEPDAITIAAKKPEGESDAEALPRFSMVAYTGDAMKVDGWRHPVVVDLDGLHVPSQRRPIRFAHSAFQGIGHSERIAVEGGRLIAQGIVSRDTTVAREVVTSGKRGFPWQASIGTTVQQSEFVRQGEFVTVNGRSFEGPLFVARKTTLGEISFVDLGADAGTEARIAAKQQPQPQEPDPMPTTPDPTTAVEAADTDSTPETPDRIAASAEPAVDDDPVKAMREQAAAESKRIAAIRRLCANASNTSGGGGGAGDIEATAIAEGWDATRTELELLRASRPKLDGAPAVHSPDHSINAEVLEAACLLSAKIGKPEDHASEQALDVAAKRFTGGIGLQELLLEAAWANGYHGRGFRDPRSIMRAAFAPPSGESIHAAFSTIDVGGILSNVANKFLLEGFFSVERTWRNICAVRSVSDFKTVTSYRLVGKDEYELVAPGGEIKHGTLGELAYANRADTYGLMLSIDRRDIFNDDLGAITAVPRKLGRGSGLKINDIFWAVFLDNDPFFSVGHNNLLGAPSELTIDGLSAAEVLYNDQVDPDGKPVGGIPQVLLVPTALAAMGTALYKSLELRSTMTTDTSAGQPYPVANPHTGKFRVEVSRYLSNAQYPGHSSAAWYLLADPMDLPVIEVAFLNGQESPTIETAEADFNELGVRMRGYHDFGVALQEYRGGVKALGEPAGG